MKKHLLSKLLFLLLLLPVRLFSQPTPSQDIDITGLWKGQLYNDSTKKWLDYEIAISEDQGKLSGYSYIVFDIDGKKEIGTKKVKIKREDEKVLIEDVEFIQNNYTVAPGRGVRVMSSLNLSVNDTAMLLTGSWKTNRTRQYSPLTGNLHLQRKPDFRPLALYKKLQELKLEKNLSFVQMEQAGLAKENANKPVPLVDKPFEPDTSKVIAIDKTGVNSNEVFLQPLQGDVDASIVAIEIPKAVNKNQQKKIANPAINKAKEAAIPPAVKTEVLAAVIEPRVADNTPTEKKEVVNVPNKLANNPAPPVKKVEILVVKNDPPKQKAIPGPALNNKPVVKEPVVQVNKPQLIVTNNPPTPKIKPVEYTTGKFKKPANTFIEKKPAAVVADQPAKIIKPKEIAAPVIEQKKEILTAPLVTAAAEVGERKINNIQSVFYQSDSLVLTLYDNGEVDGDTVSVVMNGKIIISKQGLDTKPNFKTIKITSETPDSIMLVMYAENLGSIPPNTGLLVVHDGDAVYEVRFSADLKTNAAILLRRQKKK